MSVYRLAAASELGPDFDVSRADPTLTDAKAPSLERVFQVTPEVLHALFLERYGLGFVARHFGGRDLPLQVVTHPRKTNTCFEKAEMLGCDPLDVVKALVCEVPDTGALSIFVVPETGCFLDKARLADLFRLSRGDLRNARQLPKHMEAGTCSPFVLAEDLAPNGGRVERIVFDGETLAAKRATPGLDDFSFGLDHRMSIQMSYAACFDMLKELYADVVVEAELLNLSFKEIMVREKGKLRISYEFRSLNYNLAKVVNGIHGRGDVTIVNDHVDELDVPDVLVGPRSRP